MSLWTIPARSAAANAEAFFEEGAKKDDEEDAGEEAEDGAEKKD